MKWYRVIISFGHAIARRGAAMTLVTRRRVLQMVGVVAATGLTHWTGGDSSPDSLPIAEGLSSAMIIMVDVDEDNVIHAIFPDGTETSGQDAYEAKISELDQQGIIQDT